MPSSPCEQMRARPHGFASEGPVIRFRHPEEPAWTPTTLTRWPSVWRPRQPAAPPSARWRPGSPQRPRSGSCRPRDPRRPGANVLSSPSPPGAIGTERGAIADAKRHPARRVARRPALYPLRYWRPATGGVAPAGMAPACRLSGRRPGLPCSCASNSSRAWRWWPWGSGSGRSATARAPSTGWSRDPRLAISATGTRRRPTRPVRHATRTISQGNGQGDVTRERTGGGPTATREPPQRERLTREPRTHVPPV